MILQMTRCLLVLSFLWVLWEKSALHRLQYQVDHQVDKKQISSTFVLMCLMEAWHKLVYENNTKRWKRLICSSQIQKTQISLKMLIQVFFLFSILLCLYNIDIVKCLQENSDYEELVQWPHQTCEVFLAIWKSVGTSISYKQESDFQVWITLSHCEFNQLPLAQNTQKFSPFSPPSPPNYFYSYTLQNRLWDGRIWNHTHRCWTVPNNNNRFGIC